MNDLVEVRPGVYRDSVTLMRVSRALTEHPGATVAVVAMATELNLGLARDLGFAVPPATPGDLLVAVRAARRRSWRPPPPNWSGNSPHGRRRTARGARRRRVRPGRRRGPSRRAWPW
ncbi:hypothetical protein GCM10027612_64900 [Microbispora bryophytorum subsp. camponoti]